MVLQISSTFFLSILTSYKNKNLPSVRTEG
jgi:hypothetical protein